MKQPQIPTAVLFALQMVRKTFPHVCMVAFNKDQRWLYMDEDFDAPNFDTAPEGAIDTSVLEDAADAVTQFPSIYQIE